MKNEKTCIEVDGGYWHKDKLKEDLKKNNYFKNLGYDTLRVREESLPVISEDDIAFVKGKYVTNFYKPEYSNNYFSNQLVILQIFRGCNCRQRWAASAALIQSYMVIKM